MTYPLGGANAKQELSLASERVNYLRDLLFNIQNITPDKSASTISAAIREILDRELAQIQANRSNYPSEVQLHMATRTLRQVQRILVAHAADFVWQLERLYMQSEAYQNELAAANSSFFHLTNTGTERAASAAAEKLKSATEAILGSSKKRPREDTEQQEDIITESDQAPSRKTQKVDSVEPEAFAAILILGPESALDNPMGPGTLVIGDGIRVLSKAELEKSLYDNRNKIDDRTRILISTHGRVGRNDHNLNLYLSKSPTSSAAVLKFIASVVGKPVHVTICCCFSGAGAKDYAVLSEHSTLSTIGYPDSVTHAGLVNHLIKTALKFPIFGSEQSELRNPFARFAKDLLCNPSLYCSFSPNIAGVEAFKSRFPEQFSREAIMQHQRYEFARFVRYCVDNKNKMSAEQVLMVESLVSSLKEYNLFAIPPRQWVENPPAWARDLQDECVEVLVNNCMVSEYFGKLVDNDKLCSRQMEAIAAGFRANGVIVSTGIPPLHQACYRGNIQEMAKAFAARPGSVNIRDYFGHTPLMVTCINGDVTALQFLLDHGVVPNFRQESANIGMGVLQVALLKGHTAIVKILLEAGADIEPILLRGNADHIRALKAAGADIDTQFANQQVNTIQICLENDDKASLMTLFEEGASLEPGILHKAVKWNAVNCLGPLLAQSAGEPNHQANVQAALDAAKARQPNSPAVTQALEQCLSKLKPQGTALNAATITPAASVRGIQ